MSYGKSIVSITVTSLVVFGIIQGGTSKNFNIKKYLGKWYTIAQIHANPFKSDDRSNRLISCEWLDVTEHEDGRVEEVYTFILRGKPESCEGNVTLINSDLCVVYPDGPHLYTIQTFNNYKDLILIDKKNRMSSVLISRNTKISSEATESFEKIAAYLDGYVYYINNSDCI